MQDTTLALVSNIATAVAYYSLTYQLFKFVRHSHLASLLAVLQKSNDQKKRNLFLMIVSLAALFASFIALCGNTHTLNVFLHYYPDSTAVQYAQTAMLAICALVSIATAGVSYKLFPMILEVLSKFELNSEGNLQHVENYLVEVVEMVKESVVVLGEDLKISRCNEASKTLLNCSVLVGETITDFVHPEDVRAFEEAMLVALSGYSQTPVTLEYRICREVAQEGLSDHGTLVHSSTKPQSFFTTSGTRKVHASLEMPALKTTSPKSSHSALSASMPTIVSGLSERSFLPSGKLSGAVEYIWVESTVCKGMRLSQSDDFNYDLKMVTRDIEDRKRQAQTQLENILRESQEQARINAAKLRYISCIAHDLKTPLQSFCFSLDLLGQTPMHAEQRECVEQANVAVDLMKLTISQTMDISKALTGAKLTPRCTTVSLPSVLGRVKVIINGYGKQVPITFEVASEVCSEVITDEEWLWQMLLNLLTNACKYTDKGGITVAISVSCEVALPAASDESTIGDARPSSPRSVALLFEVADTGVGVSSAKIDHMFEAFNQVQEGQVTGTGLGLFGVRQRVEGLHGTCGARHNTSSATGTGTVMWFAIPYKPDHTTTAAQSRAITRASSYCHSRSFDLTMMDAPFVEPMQTGSPGPARRVSMTAVNPLQLELTVAAPSDLAKRTEDYVRSKGLTAMVVDDTPTVRKLMERLLRKMGFAAVTCYENGSKGLDAMMAGQVDIVFSDVQMPIMTGPEMASRFRSWEASALSSGSRTRRQLIVAVTANGGQAGKGGDTGGFDEICGKPLGANDIYQVIQKHL